MRRLLIGLLLLFGVLAVLVTANTLRFASRQVEAQPVAVVQNPDAAEHLAASVTIPTVTHEDVRSTSGEAFLVLHDFLTRTYPNVHAALHRETVNRYSLLYMWAGRDTTLAPIILTGHLDVAPVDPETVGQWVHPPFAGRQDGTYVWGRGSMDDRFTILGVLEAVERLLQEGYRPARTVYLAFGHDEERGGLMGARALAALLRDRGIRPEYVLDEGLFVTNGMVPGVQAPVALIGVGEKGSMSLELTVRMPGGHSSAPPKETAIGILSRAVARVEASPMPARLRGPAKQLFAYIGPEMDWLSRLAFANLWLFGPFVEQQLADRPTTNTLIRTTTAPTIIQSGIKENLLPSVAEAVVNFRILPGDSAKSIMAHVRDVIADPRIQIRLRHNYSEPSHMSDTASAGFRNIHRAIRQVFPEALVAPSIMIARTDARHYAVLTKNVYRFVPLRVGPDDVTRFHGVNERVAAENFYQGIQFYYQLIKSSTS